LKPSEYCTINIYQLSLVNSTYISMSGGNAAYLAVFTALLALDRHLYIENKTWKRTVGTVGGVTLEARD
jgi:hypothetical protein